MKRLARIITLIAIGLAPFALLAFNKVGGDVVAQASQPGPWPYCIPDVAAPSYKALPYQLPSPDATIFTPSALGFLRLRSVPDPDRSGSGSDRVLSSVEVSDVKTFGPGLDPEGGTWTVRVNPGLLEDLQTALKLDHEVWLAVDATDVDGVPSISFAVDATGKEFLAPDWAEGASILASDFLREPSGEVTSFIDRVFSWNAESEGVGSYSAAWHEFLQTYGVRLDLDVPPVGTQAYWDAAPPSCRSYYDAPSEITDGLPIKTLTVYVPKVGFPADAVLCARADSGGMGCSDFDTGSLGVVHLDVYDTGETIRIQLALQMDRGVSWSQRVELTTVELENTNGQDEPAPIDLLGELEHETYAAVASEVE